VRINLSSIFNKLPVQIILHLVCWGLFLSLPFLLSTPPNQPGVKLPPIPDEYVILFYLLDVPLFYLNAYVLIPKILKTKGVFIYLLSVIAVISIILSLNLAVRNYLLVPIGYSVRVTIWTLFPIILLYAVSTSLKLFTDFIADERQRKELENEKLKSELSFLRSQISPHFMFNVLNSLVSLARKKSDLLEPVIIKLSDLLRYMLYESDELKVSLDKEMRYLESYIELQRLRFGNNVKISFRVDNLSPHQMIEPMLLIPFVENAFKHGTGMVSNPVIEVYVDSTDEYFLFRVTNKVNTKFKEEKDRSSGIGLSNVRRRLSLLYPNNHEMEASEQNGWFVAELSLRLKDQTPVANRFSLSSTLKKVS
jgi:two-component system, LytTR family, sensor kinase